MRTFLRLTSIASIAVLASVANATDILPTIVASIHDQPHDGTPDSFNLAPFEGLLRLQGGNREDRAIQEFDVSAFTLQPISLATLSGRISVNNSFDNGPRTFDFLLYSGNGVADLTDYSIAATFVGNGQYHPPAQTSFTYSFDVTAVAQTLLNGGATWIGLKVVCTSDPNFPNILELADTTGPVSILAIDVPSTVGTAFCPGDGTGTACPCGNNSPVGANAGCLSSLGTGGTLIATGAASLAADTVVLSGSGMPNSSALYFQGTAQQTGGAGAQFGDGLRCASGTIVRLGTKTNVFGSSQYPSGTDPSVSVKGLIAAPGVRTYQVWYRNAASFCTPSTFNLSNGWQITWGA
jgi:hypothetical protein